MSSVRRFPTIVLALSYFLVETNTLVSGRTTRDTATAHLTFVDGDQHVGEYKDGKPNGHGTYIWADGDKYVGEYKDGKPNGHGTYIWADGDKYVGEYKDGKPWEGIKYSASGKVQETYLNGEPCPGCEPNCQATCALVREIDPSLITAALPPCPTSGCFP